ncbi:hypothetical protein Q4E40_03940 [Pontibacter sp. BT731]|uniref:hypothetical protein n=1 Tax=Pontibacter coccineus TaxID=3063328 RepID=UPI0026E1C17A|nr:hypothetical protein [Pontibacter sp. BT731]MDO6389265.1 hypothetical protein [Pontibacter sp. BT731]
MKKFILLPILALFFLFSCEKDSPKPELPTLMNLKVMKEKKLSSGTITTEPKTAIIHVWNAENSEFDIDASPDIIFGYAYDKSSASFKTMKYGAIGSVMKEKIEPGRYFIYVLLPKSSDRSSLAYSYSYFEIKAGQTLDLFKVFSYDISSGTFEQWSENQ